MGIASRDAIGIVLGLQLQNALANLLHHAADVVAKVIGCTLALTFSSMPCSLGASSLLAPALMSLHSANFATRALRICFESTSAAD